MTPLQTIQHLDKYSRFIEEKGRRETWEETVQRSIDFLKEISKNKLPNNIYNQIKNYILEMKALPSMRLMASAGKAARKNNIALYNCSFTPIDCIDSFVEILTISMCGTGVGYSVERKYIDLLPKISTIQEWKVSPIFVVEDSSEGWAEALKTGLYIWWSGGDIKFSFQNIRPKGAVLKTKGGRASGPDPLINMLNFSRKIIRNKAGKRLSTLEVHDIACKIGECVIQGGVRRTALISLFDYNDKEMLHCKNGNLGNNFHRWNANNSTVWNGTMTKEQISNQMNIMHNGMRGEPGIFSRDAALNNIPKRRIIDDFGTNPCGEIILRPMQFCNLSIAVARHDDTLVSLKEKVKIATIIGTIQSMATDFKGIRPIWKKNCEEERLLGVDITGQLDCPIVQDKIILSILKDLAINTNKEFSKLLGINPSTAITCAKPSGNSSVLVDCSPGIHARFSPYYIRRLRFDANSPIHKLLKLSGYSLKPENGQTLENATAFVASFPVKSPNGIITIKERSAMQQLEYWKLVKEFWCEHNPSATISYDNEEIEDVTEWVFQNQEIIGGLSFLPKSDALYEQMPYEEITEKQYSEMILNLPEIRLDMLDKVEDYDQTTVSQELACVGGACLI